MNGEGGGLILDLASRRGEGGEVGKRGSEKGQGAFNIVVFLTKREGGGRGEWTPVVRTRYWGEEERKKRYRSKKKKEKKKIVVLLPGGGKGGRGGSYSFCEKGGKTVSL